METPPRQLRAAQDHGIAVWNRLPLLHPSPRLGDRSRLCKLAGADVQSGRERLSDEVCCVRVRELYRLRIRCAAQGVVAAVTEHDSASGRLLFDYPLVCGERLGPRVDTGRVP